MNLFVIWLMFLSEDGLHNSPDNGSQSLLGFFVVGGSAQALELGCRGRGSDAGACASVTVNWISLLEWDHLSTIFRFSFWKGDVEKGHGIRVNCKFGLTAFSCSMLSRQPEQLPR